MSKDTTVGEVVGEKTSLFQNDIISLQRESHYAPEGEHRSRVTLHIDLKKVYPEGKYTGMTVEAHNAPISPSGDTPKAKEVVIRLMDNAGKETILEGQTYRVHPDKVLMREDGKLQHDAAVHVKTLEPGDIEKGGRITNLNIDYALDMVAHQVFADLPSNKANLGHEFTGALRQAVSVLADEERQLVNRDESTQRAALTDHVRNLADVMPPKEEEEQARTRWKGLTRVLEKIKSVLRRGKSSAPVVADDVTAPKVVAENQPPITAESPVAEALAVSGRPSVERADPASEHPVTIVARKGEFVNAPGIVGEEAAAVSPAAAQTSSEPPEWRYVRGINQCNVYEAQIGDAIARSLKFKNLARGGLRDAEMTFHPPIPSDSADVGGVINMKLTARDNTIFNANMIINEGKVELPPNLKQWLTDHESASFREIVEYAIKPLQQVVSIENLHHIQDRLDSIAQHSETHAANHERRTGDGHAAALEGEKERDNGNVASR